MYALIVKALVEVIVDVNYKITFSVYIRMFIVYVC